MRSGGWDRGGMPRRVRMPSPRAIRVFTISYAPRGGERRHVGGMLFQAGRPATLA